MTNQCKKDANPKQPSSSSQQGDRPQFLKTTTLAAGGVALDQSSTTRSARVSSPAESERTSNRGVKYPRVFTGAQRRMISFPLGGVATGSIGLGGRGQLLNWEIFNHPDKGMTPQQSFPSIWVQSGRRKPVARVLEARMLPPYEGPTGLGAMNVPG